MAAGSRIGKWMFFGVIAVIGAWFAGALAMAWLQRDARVWEREFSERVPGESMHPVSIRKPAGVPLVDTGKKDAHGRPVMVSCATCHDTRKGDFTTADAAALDEFHQGMKYRHGEQTCLSCHNPADYNTLKRADGRALDFTDSMKLCAQCHGPQFRDYENGSHGGMTGYWDLRQGPRERNHCTDCHDPHHPAYPLVLPVFPPKPVPGEPVPRGGDSSHH